MLLKGLIHQIFDPVFGNYLPLFCDWQSKSNNAYVMEGALQKLTILACESGLKISCHLIYILQRQSIMCFLNKCHKLKLFFDALNTLYNKIWAYTSTLGNINGYS